jgi:hypothetical protein
VVARTEPSARADVGQEPLNPAEVKQLRWLLDGGIMHASVREELRRSWGLCPRHAWGYALVEIELRGGLPFSTSILVEDLLVECPRGGRGPWLGSRRRHLAGSDDCPTCRYATAEPEVERSWSDEAELVSRADRMRMLVASRRSALTHWACPECLGGGGLTCRPHLVGGAAISRRLTDELHELAQRAQAYRRSTEPGEEHELDERTAIAWAEALGWLAGWGVLSAWGLADGGDPKIRR